MNILFLLAIMLIFLLIGTGLYRVLMQKQPWQWEEILFAVILGIQVILMINRYVTIPRTMLYAWYCLLNSRYDQVLALLICAGLLVLWLKLRYAVHGAFFVYLPIYAVVLFYVSGQSGKAPFVLPAERSIILILHNTCMVCAYTCSIMAGVLSIAWIGYEITRRLRLGLFSGSEQEKIFKLIIRFIRLFFPFFIMGFFSLVVWAYQTQGVLWTYNRAIMAGIPMALLYLLCNAVRSKYEKSDISAIVVSVVNSCIVWVVLCR